MKFWRDFFAKFLSVWALLGHHWALNTGQLRLQVVTTGQPKLLTSIGLWMKVLGAGDENRTRVLSLGN